MDPKLPSSAALIDSFLQDLRGIAGLFRGEGPSEKPTRTIFFTSATTAIQNWTADADYFVTGVTANTGSIQVLSRDGSPTGIVVAADKVNSNPGLILAQSLAGFIFGLRFPLPAGSKLYWAPAASGEFCNVLLQYA
jgi:hypothetical protein